MTVIQFETSSFGEKPKEEDPEPLDDRSIRGSQRVGRVAICGNGDFADAVREIFSEEPRLVIEEFVDTYDEIPKVVQETEIDAVVLVPASEEELKKEIVQNTERGVPFVVVSPTDETFDISPLEKGIDPYFSNQIIEASIPNELTKQATINLTTSIVEAIEDYRLWP